MRLRTKLLILLLLIALAPILVVGLSSRRTALAFGSGLAEEIESELISRARSDLRRRVASYTELLDKEKSLVETLVLLQGREASRLLREPASASAPPSFWTGEDIDEGRRPPGMVVSERMVRRDGSNGAERVALSLAEPVFVPAPEVGVREVEEAALRLRPLIDLKIELREGRPDLVRHQFVALSSGVYMSYPATGGYPEGFDARETAWYERASQFTDQTVWTMPVIDPVTGTAGMVCVRPLRDANGELLGVAGIELAIDEVLRGIPVDDISNVPLSLLIGIPRGASHFDERLRVFSQTENREGGGRGWRAAEEPALLEPFMLEGLERAEDRDRARRLVVDIERAAEGRSVSTVREVMFRGETSMAAFEPFASDPSFFFMFITPTEPVVRSAVNMRDQVVRRTETEMTVMLTMTVGIAAMTMLLALLASRTVTRRVNDVASAARKLASGDLDATTNIRGNDEIAELGAAFNEMMPRLREHLRMSQSLGLAMGVQRGLLPGDSPAIEGFDAHGLSRYCDETGGDYYDFIRSASGAWAVTVGDVSGHGVAAALLMTTARAVLRRSADATDCPREIVKDINRHLANDARLGHFMTLFLMMIDPEVGEGSRKLRWVNAGHESAIVYDPRTDSFDELTGGGIPVGIERDWPYESHECACPDPGTVIVIGTDGIWEARDPGGVMFGRDAFRELIRRNAGESAERIARTIIGEVTKFCRDAPRTDDITLVVLKRVQVGDGA